MRSAKGPSEYDLLLRPGARLEHVVVEVEGADRLERAADGSLRIETRVGTLVQPVPTTFVLDGTGTRRELHCRFVVLGPARFGFAVDEWDGRAPLTIDPPLIWSTLLGGGRAFDVESVEAMHVGGDGRVTIAGVSGAPDFPTTSGAYDTTFNRFQDVCISVLDPSKTGPAQLSYSTYFGGSFGNDLVRDMVVDEKSSLVVICGQTTSFDYPVTPNAYARGVQGQSEGFVAGFDLSKSGANQLIYSTFLGGNRNDTIAAVTLDGSARVVIAGATRSTDFPTAGNPFDAQGPTASDNDAFVALLDTKKSGTAQLLFSTFLGRPGLFLDEGATAVHVDDKGVITVAGTTADRAFPTTTSVFPRQTTSLGFLTRLDPQKSGSAQLLYSWRSTARRSTR